MKQNQWSLTVGNVGTVWAGTNGAQAFREYGTWRKASINDETRAAGEPVTLFRNGEPVRAHLGHTWFLFRRGDGNDGNFPIFYVRVPGDVNPYRYLAACVANRYISGSSTRRYIVKHLQIDGDPEYGIDAWVHEGPKGEQPFGAAWLTACFKPASISENTHGRPEFKYADSHLDRAAMRMLKGK